METRDRPTAPRVRPFRGFALAHALATALAVATGIAVAFGMAVAAGAQTAGTHRGLFAGLFNGPPGVGYLLQLDASNRATSFVSMPGGPWSTWGNAFGLAVDVDNRHVIVPTLLDPGATTWGLVRWDPVAKRVASTIWSGPLDAKSVRNWSDWTINADGNPVTIDNATNPPAIAEFDRFRNAWVRRPLPSSVVPFAGLAGFEWDKLNGGYRHAAWGAFGLWPTSLYRTTSNATRTTLLAQTTVNVGGFGGGLTDNGDWYSADNGPSGYRFVAANTSTWAAGPPGPVLSDLTPETFAASGSGFYAAVDDTFRSLVYIDPVARTTIVYHTATATTMPTPAAELTPLFSRDLCSVRTGKGTWSLKLNPGEGLFAGKRYVCAASILPPTVPIALADGREIFLGVDPLFFVTLFSQFPPFFTGNLGALDAAGTAEPKVDFSSLGTQFNGLVIHFCAAVIDAAAPGGIGWVTDPHALPILVIP